MNRSKISPWIKGTIETTAIVLVILFIMIGLLNTSADQYLTIFPNYSCTSENSGGCIFTPEQYRRVMFATQLAVVFPYISFSALFLYHKLRLRHVKNVSIIKNYLLASILPILSLAYQLVIGLIFIISKVDQLL